MKAKQQSLSKLIIKQEYLELVPRLSEADRDNLKKSLKKDGQLIAVICNPDGIILDGHTRYELCNELGLLPIKYRVMKFENPDDEMKFVVMTNIARRHLNKFQKVEMAWPLFELEKQRALERVNWKTDKSLCVTDQEGKIVKAKKKIKEGLSAELFGKKIGVGHTFVNQVEYIKKFADEKLLAKVRGGELSASMAFDLLHGQKLMSDGKKPDKPIKFCPKCNTETTNPKRTNCHVHKWFCCSHCKWGI